jgi:tRNA pseudouridine38-40 synthase
MQKYKIIIAYEGTNFHGWQIQPNVVTVASRLEKTFQRIFNKKITLFGASRTDAGVHALGQVAQFHTTLNIDHNRMRFAWNNALPPTIYIRSLSPVSTSFHPCCNVMQKIYLYHIFLKRPLPCFFRYGFFYQYIDRLDIKKFEMCLKLYRGTYDFASFCKVDLNKETVRTIDDISCHHFTVQNILRVTIKGKSFLRYQIRRMVGYALDVACSPSLSVDYLKNVLKEKNPKQRLLKADSAGLCLKRVQYHENA